MYKFYVYIAIHLCVCVRVLECNQIYSNILKLVVCILLRVLGQVHLQMVIRPKHVAVTK
jgi:hypothetical protein